MTSGIKNTVLLFVIAGLSGCGGPERFEGNTRAARPMAAGPISTACLQSDRKARSTALCGCIQAVANDTLTGSDQRRAIDFYADPHSAQEIRQSDRARDENFWRRYTDYAMKSERICS